VSQQLLNQSDITSVCDQCTGQRAPQGVEPNGPGDPCLAGDLSSLVRINKTVARDEEAEEVKVVDNRPDFELLEKQRDAVTKVDNSANDAVYKGLALVTNPQGKAIAAAIAADNEQCLASRADSMATSRHGILAA